MAHEHQEDSLKTLQDIRSIMERSARFISLSGWSGVWAGCVALAGSLVARSWLKDLPGAYYSPYRTAPASVPDEDYNSIVLRFVLLAIGVLIVALIGGYYFTWRKTRLLGSKLWNNASRRMVIQIAIPLAAGGLFALNFLHDRHEAYVAPTCLVFYGLALINGSKYTLSDIQYLGLLEMALGCISLFFPGYGLTFWAIGFGALHILYGIIVWNKYDKQISKTAE